MSFSKKKNLGRCGVVACAIAIELFVSACSDSATEGAVEDESSAVTTTERSDPALGVSQQRLILRPLTLDTLECEDQCEANYQSCLQDAGSEVTPAVVHYCVALLRDCKRRCR